MQRTLFTCDAHRQRHFRPDKWHIFLQKVLRRRHVGSTSMHYQLFFRVGSRTCKKWKDLMDLEYIATRGSKAAHSCTQLVSMSHSSYLRRSFSTASLKNVNSETWADVDFEWFWAFCRWWKQGRMTDLLLKHSTLFLSTKWRIAVWVMWSVISLPAIPSTTISTISIHAF